MHPHAGLALMETDVETHLRKKWAEKEVSRPKSAHFLCVLPEGRFVLQEGRCTYLFSMPSG